MAWTPPHPYHVWERGLNKNTNALIRHYQPKGTRFNSLSEADVQNMMKNSIIVLGIALVSKHPIRYSFKAMNREAYSLQYSGPTRQLHLQKARPRVSSLSFLRQQNK